MEWRVCSIVVLCALLTCSVQEDVVASSVGPPPENTSIPAVENEGHVLAEQINDFGLNMLKKMIELEPGKNVVNSPATVAGLMAMALLGSVGTTFEEILRVMGFSSDVLSYRKRHQLFGDLLSELNSDNATKTSFANAVFVDEHVKLRELYRNFTERIYHGTITNVDFKDKLNTKDFINKWVKEHTNDKIPVFLNEPLNPDTKVVLLSALYFAGQWEVPFNPTFTQNMKFVKENGTEIEAELMLNYGKFHYTYDRSIDADMVTIPYKGDETALYAIKPLGKGTPLADLLKKLDSKKLDELIERSTSETCIIRFPKMQLNYRSELRDSLNQLGINTMFTNRANFGLMIEAPEWKNTTEDESLILRTTEDFDRPGGKLSLELLNKLPNPGVFVDSIIHEVQMNINEYGTEASAAVSGFLSRTANLFYTDSPFYFFIRNKKTKLVTFSAAIFDPTEK